MLELHQTKFESMTGELQAKEETNYSIRPRQQKQGYFGPPKFDRGIDHSGLRVVVAGKHLCPRLFSRLYTIHQLKQIGMLDPNVNPLRRLVSENLYTFRSDFRNQLLLHSW